MKTSKRILSVTVKRMVDDSPDTSYLGEYSNQATSEFSIDRQHSADCAAQEYNHREAVDTLERAMNRVLGMLRHSHIMFADLTPEEVRKYTRQDYDRMEDYNRGGWCYIGIRAEAEISIPSGHFLSGSRGGEQCYLSQTITSGGLWGIKSDSEDSYFAEVTGEELADLKAQLLALGFSKRAISQAFKPENIKECDA